VRLRIFFSTALCADFFLKKKKEKKDCGFFLPQVEKTVLSAEQITDFSMRRKKCIRFFSFALCAVFFI
jgi:hypothetical protein